MDQNSDRRPLTGPSNSPFSGEDNMRTIPHFIGGKEVAGNSGRFSDVFNPATGEVQAKVALANKAEVDAAGERPSPALFTPSHPPPPPPGPRIFATTELVL